MSTGFMWYRVGPARYLTFRVTRTVGKFGVSEEILTYEDGVCFVDLL